MSSPPGRRSNLSDHLALEIAAAFGRAPLDPGAAVPGCPCEFCTKLPDDHPARIPAWRRANPECVNWSDREPEERWASRVDVARRLGIVEVALRLGCGEPVRRGRELAVRCPLHEDNEPSCTLDVTAGLWYCFPCGEGGDGIDLYMRARRVAFVDAVRELTT